MDPNVKGFSNNLSHLSKDDGEAKKIERKDIKGKLVNDIAAIRRAEDPPVRGQDIEEEKLFNAIAAILSAGTVTSFPLSIS